ncbi:MAG TPA: uroporphyrinogen-III synthase [Hyphomonadaceae bacterium]|nr:uroporphyrinogen-III synthase [Hyphomonadaceae bacterium]
MSPSAPFRVLVTRSEPGASETARRLAELGYAPVVEPLFAIEAIAAVLPPYDALAFTSANGVRAFAKLDPTRDRPVFCVGARTAQEALDLGFGQVVSADGDVNDLAALIENRLPEGARLLHSGNEESRGDLSGNLAEKGIQASFVATFRAAPVVRPGRRLAAHLSGKPAFDAVLIHSARAATILSQFAAGAPRRAQLDVASISAEAAGPLAHLARHIQTAARPNEAALFDSLGLLPDLG